MGTRFVSARAWVRTILVVIVALLAQTTVVLDLRIGGAHPDVVGMLPIAAGLAAGPEEGALMGFLAGMGIDLFLPTPFGLSALVGCLIGFGVGRATQAVDKSIWWLTPLVALTASAVAVMLYAVLGAILGDDSVLHVDLVAVVGVVSVVNAILAVPITAFVRWAIQPNPIGKRRTLATGARW
jgi:rod shape-determining protein MreD